MFEKQTFEAKQTRAYPVEVTVASIERPEAIAVFSGDGAQDRADVYAAWMTGPVESDAPTEPVAPKAKR